MIKVSDVQPTAREFRPITGGWGAGIHLACLILTCAWPFGFIAYAISVEVLAGDVLPPFWMSGFLFGTLAVWFLGRWVAGRASVSAVRNSPAGDRSWNWSISRDGIAFTNGLQTSSIDWRAMKAVREESDRILFLVTPANNPVLPKRLLNDTQLADLRVLIADVTASGRLGRGVD
jgi:hypothetical protein